jgi:two-component sensor histidine kinase
MPRALDEPQAADVDSVREIFVLDLTHRLKNVYAVVGGVLDLAARAQPEMRPFARRIRDRIAALEAAHAYLIDPPAAPTERTVQGLLHLLIAPFDSEQTKTFAIHGRDVALSGRLGATLALIMRELATNSVKYGALSAEAGHIEIACSEDESGYAVEWRESGGPAIAGAPTREGLGSHLIERAAAASGLTVEREWRPDGLTARIVVPTEHLSR